MININNPHLNISPVDHLALMKFVVSNNTDSVWNIFNPSMYSVFKVIFF